MKNIPVNVNLGFCLETAETDGEKLADIIQDIEDIIANAFPEPMDCGPNGDWFHLTHSEIQVFPELAEDVEFL